MDKKKDYKLNLKKNNSNHIIVFYIYNSNYTCNTYKNSVLNFFIRLNNSSSLNEAHSCAQRLHSLINFSLFASLIS